MRRESCVACGRTPSECAHVGGGGIGLKGPWWKTAPLCSDCHRRLHQVGRVTFEREAGVDLDAEAERYREEMPAGAFPDEEPDY